MPSLTGLFALALLAAAPLRVPVTRDVWLSDVGREADGNNGAAPQLKLKSYQEMTLVDVDPAPMKGRVVVAATLHVRLSAAPALKRVTVGTFGAPWVEGTGRSYESQPGSSTFRHAKHPDVPWTPDGGDLCRVMLGQGGTRWKMADASAPDADRWQTVAVDPAVFAARVAGVSYGFLLFDDTGSEWTRQGEKFTVEHMPNRFVYSRDQNASSAPYFTVTLGPDDRTPPPAPIDVRSTDAGLPAGEADVSWATPRDSGPAGVSGFFVRADGRPVPQSLVPAAGPDGGRVSMRLRDPGIEAGRVGLTGGPRRRRRGKCRAAREGEPPRLVEGARPAPRQESRAASDRRRPGSPSWGGPRSRSSTNLTSFSPSTAASPRSGAELFRR